MKVLLWGSFVVLAIGAPSALRQSGLRLDYSDSVPIGLYQVERSAPYAGLCMAADTLRPALAAGLELGKGECPDGHQPLLKTVYRARPEAPISLDLDGFTIAGARMPNTAPKPFSKTGKRLEHYHFGTYRSGLWAISSYNRDSYDSRYFGPMEEGDVRFYAKPLLVFGKGVLGWQTN